MNNLDVYTEHWLDQGGSQDPASKSWEDLHDTDVDHRLHRPGERDRQNDDMDSDVRQAMDEARGRAEEREAFDRSKSSRDELTGRYTDSKLGDLISSFAGWDKQFRADPHGAADALASHYLRQPPGLSKSGKPPEEGKPPPEGMRESWRGDWERDQDVMRAVREVTQAKNEDIEFTATAEHRQLLKQAFPHLTFDKALERIVQIDRDLLTNPLEAAGRLGASYGMPVTHGQHRAVENEAKVARAQTLVDHVVANNVLPGLGTPAVDAATAAILEDRNFPRSGDHFQDLRNAHDLALQQIAAGHAPAPDNRRANDGAEATLVAHYPDGTNSVQNWQDLQDALGNLERRISEGAPSAADKARKASRSISGSPSPGASSGGQRWDEIEDAARAAYRSASASV